MTGSVRGRREWSSLSATEQPGATALVSALEGASAGIGGQPHLFTLSLR